MDEQENTYPQPRCPMKCQDADDCDGSCADGFGPDVVPPVVHAMSPLQITEDQDGFLVSGGDIRSERTGSLRRVLPDDEAMSPLRVDTELWIVEYWAGSQDGEEGAWKRVEGLEAFPSRSTAERWEMSNDAYFRAGTRIVRLEATALPVREAQESVGSAEWGKSLGDALVPEHAAPVPQLPEESRAYRVAELDVPEGANGPHWAYSIKPSSEEQSPWPDKLPEESAGDATGYQRALQELAEKLSAACGEKQPDTAGPGHAMGVALKKVAELEAALAQQPQHAERPNMLNWRSIVEIPAQHAEVPAGRRCGKCGSSLNVREQMCDVCFDKWMAERAAQSAEAVRADALLREAIAFWDSENRDVEYAELMGEWRTRVRAFLALAPTQEGPTVAQHAARIAELEEALTIIAEGTRATQWERDVMNIPFAVLCSWNFEHNGRVEAERKMAQHAALVEKYQHYWGAVYAYDPMREQEAARQWNTIINAILAAEPAEPAQPMRNATEGEGA